MGRSCRQIKCLKKILLTDLIIKMPSSGMIRENGFAGSLESIQYLTGNQNISQVCVMMMPHDNIAVFYLINNIGIIAINQLVINIVLTTIRLPLRSETIILMMYRNSHTLLCLTTYKINELLPNSVNIESFNINYLLQ